jgi:hypothetical protein
MPETNLNIILKLYDQATEGIKKVSDDLESFSQTVKHTGKELSQVGGTLAMAGAAITGPFALAFNGAASSVGSVNQSLMGLTNVTNSFQETIAKGMVPVVDNVTRILNNLLNVFNGLSPALQQGIIQGTLYAGIFLMLGGGVTMVAGKILVLIGNIGLLTSSFLAFAAANAPLLIMVAIIGAIIAAMMKWKAVADVVASTFQVMFIFLQNGFFAVKAAIEGALLGISSAVQWVVDILAQIPGPTQGMFQQLSEQISGFSESLRSDIVQNFDGITQNAATVGDILTTGTGAWSEGFDNLKNKISSVWAEMTRGNTVVATSSAQFRKNYDGMVGAVGQLSSAMNGMAAEHKNWAKAAQIVSIGLAIMNTAQGVTKALADYPFPVSLVVAGIIAAAGAIQIATIASQSFAVGTPNVPYDMNANIHKGEMIIPSTFSDAIRSGQLALSGAGSRGSSGTTNHISVEINNPTIRQDSDIDDLVRKVSEKIALEAERL